jgi:hypothetical protein
MSHLATLDPLPDLVLANPEVPSGLRIGEGVVGDIQLLVVRSDVFAPLMPSDDAPRTLHLASTVAWAFSSLSLTTDLLRFAGEAQSDVCRIFPRSVNLRTVPVNAFRLPR